MTDFVALGLETNPDGLALEDERRGLSYRELDAQTTAVALRLVAMGVRRGDVVATRVTPSLDGVVLLHAVFRAGGVLAPLHPQWTRPEVEAACDALRPSLVIDGPVDLNNDLEPDANLPEGPATEVAAILWTSGTAGSPRGVEITRTGLLHSARSSAARLRLVPEDRWYASLQPAHVGGLALITRAATLGSGLLATEGFNAKAFAKLLRDGQVTHASVVPVMLRAILDLTPGLDPPPTLRALLVGGARTPAPLVQEALARAWPIALTYGMTEATSQVTTAPPDEVRQHPGSVGRALSGVEVTISTDEEVLVRGPTLAQGYWASHVDLVGADGWYHTGDLGRLDAEGRLSITGRRSERIVTGGVTVDPEEVASVFRQFDGIRECVVMGVPHPLWGEVVAAVFVADVGAALDMEAVRSHQMARLASAKRARRFRVVDSLPRNKNGKVDLPRLLSLFEVKPEL